MNRAAFLERVRRAAQAGRTYRVQLAEIPDGAGYVGGGSDLCTTLAAEVDAVGGQAEILSSLHDVRPALERLLDEYTVERALCWQHSLLDQLGIQKVLEQKCIQQDSHNSLAKLSFIEQRERVLAAGVGISSADYAIAETGSLVVCSKPGRERVVTLLPPVHIAIIDESQILPDLFDLFSRLQAAGLDTLPSNLAFITGPSKTGDIELQLTTGVHGPGKWHLLIVRAT